MFLLALDFILSAAISYLVSLIASYLLGGVFFGNWSGSSILAISERMKNGIIIAFTQRQLSPFHIFICSTLFTSVRMFLILLSTALLKLLAPVHRFTGWFFDVDEHPVQAIGIVAGALLMLGSAIWTVVRAIM
jgi:hypothetical protein